MKLVFWLSDMAWNLPFSSTSSFPLHQHHRNIKIVTQQQIRFRNHSVSLNNLVSYHAYHSSYIFSCCSIAPSFPCIYGYIITLILPQSCAIIRLYVCECVHVWKMIYHFSKPSYMILKHILLMFSPLNHVIYHLCKIRLR